MPRSPRNIPTPPRQSRRAPAPRAATTSAAENSIALNARFTAALERLCVAPGIRSAIAVSGGGDSIALMHLLAQWARQTSAAPPVVLVVDHALRRGSGKDAALVLAWAEQAGLKAHLLRWKGVKPKANIEDQARLARYRLMGQWCRAHGVGTLFVGHTRDDQAETFLLRLGRGSGVDGLSAMRPRAGFPCPGFNDVTVFRPLLDMERDALRAFLAGHKIPWLEDPMNADPHFTRVRLRRILPQLEIAGVPASRIADAARHLGRAREALEWATGIFLQNHARFDNAHAVLDAGALKGVPREIGLRALGAVLMKVSGKTYRPRFERLESLFESLTAVDFKARTLLGCRLAFAPKAQAAFGPRTILVGRESPRRGPIGPESPRTAPKAASHPGSKAQTARKFAPERA